MRRSWLAEAAGSGSLGTWAQIRAIAGTTQQDQPGNRNYQTGDAKMTTENGYIEEISLYEKLITNCFQLGMSKSKSKNFALKGVIETFPYLNVKNSM